MTDTDRNDLCVAQMVETMGMGGAENLAVRVAGALARRGIRSHLIVLTDEGPLSERIHPEVRTHYLHYHRASIRNPLAFVLSLGIARRLLTDLVAAEGIRVIQTHLPGANFQGLQLTLAKVCPVLATVHNNQEFNYGDADNPIRAHLRKRAYGMILRRGAGMVAVSEEVRASMIETLRADRAAARKIAVVTNGVEIPPPLEAGRRETIRRDLGVGADELLVLSAGRFGEQKNFRDLIEAVGLAREREPRLRLVIAGDGELRPDLERQVHAAGLQDVVKLPGNRDDLSEVMQASDLFAMSSLWEGLPLVLLEAMAAGMPAAAYAIPGVTDLLEDGVHGALAPPGEPQELAAAIAGLLDDPGKRKACGEAARSLVEREYSFAILVDALLDLYDRAAVRPAAG